MTCSRQYVEAYLESDDYTFVVIQCRLCFLTYPVDLSTHAELLEEAQVRAPEGARSALHIHAVDMRLSDVSTATDGAVRAYLDGLLLCVCERAATENCLLHFDELGL